MPLLNRFKCKCNYELRPLIYNYNSRVTLSVIRIRVLRIAYCVFAITILYTDL